MYQGIVPTDKINIFLNWSIEYQYLVFGILYRIFVIISILKIIQYQEKKMNILQHGNHKRENI